MDIFINNANKISLNKEIFYTIWSEPEDRFSTDALSSVVSRLRKKISLEIENIYGLGYRLNF